MSEAMKAQLRATGLSGEDATVTCDMVGHGTKVVMDAIIAHVELAPPRLRYIILRGIIGSLIVGWRQMDPECVAESLKVDFDAALKGTVITGERS